MIKVLNPLSQESFIQHSSLKKWSDEACNQSHEVERVGGTHHFKMEGLGTLKELSTTFY